MPNILNVTLPLKQDAATQATVEALVKGRDLFLGAR